jgi:replicative DNA helicase
MFKSLMRNIFHIKRLLGDLLKNIDLKCKDMAIPDDAAIPSGFQDLDRLITGFRNGSLVIVAGRQSMGKTAFVLSAIRHIAIIGKTPVLFFSLELPKDDLAQKMLCLVARVATHKARTGHLNPPDWPHLTAAAGRISEAPIFIDDTAAISINEIRVKARRLKAKLGIGLIVIDYLQLISDSRYPEGRQSEFFNICNCLKALAMDLQIPILITSQISRNSECLPDSYPPQLFELQGRWPIEHNADTVLLLFREEFYDPTPENVGRAEVIVAKNRWGPVGNVHLLFHKEYMRFEDIQTTADN